MARPWEAVIGQLRRRAVIAGVLSYLGRWLPGTALLALSLLGVTRYGSWAPWARFLAPYLGAATLALLVVVALVGWRGSRKSAGYYAKWTDRESGLDDRLA